MAICTEGATLEELLNRPKGLLVLRGADDDNDRDDDNDDLEDDDDESDDDEDDEDDEDEDSDDDDDDSSDSEKSNKKKTKKADEKSDEIVALEKDRDRHKKRRAVAEDRVTRLLAENAELKTKSTKDEDLKREVEETNKTNETLVARNKQLSLDVAFLRDNKYSWADPKAALKLVDMSDVDIADDGSVEGLDAALRKLAKDSPYLLKTQEEPKRTPRTRTGAPATPKDKRSAAKRKAEEADLLRRYPGARR